MKLKKLSIFFLACNMTTAVHHAGAQEKLYTNEFPLSSVSLLDGPFRHARDLNIEVLLSYDMDRLLAGYAKQAGLPVKANSFTNWDGLDGHVAGHYLSALAMNYASTKDHRCKMKMDSLLAQLKLCQDANGVSHPYWGKGYVGAVPNSDKIWSNLQKGDLAPYQSSWVPWYNVHKMYAGLRDAWIYAGNREARVIFLRFCDWGIDITSALTGEQMQKMLDTEHGGMNEIFADAYEMTGDKKYLSAAIRFSHKSLLDAMEVQQDNLDNKHANTQVPKAIGFARIAEVSRSASYKTAGEFFWETVTSKRTLAFGGNSRREFFPSVKASGDFINDVEGPETCNSYNMLKLTEDLFRMNPAAKYADYYERTLYNHILSTQHPVHGGYVYFTPARPRHYRVYSTPNEGMWCCVGSGMENHSKYNQFIYTRDKGALYVNLFIASELNWNEKRIRIRQETNFPNEERTVIKIAEGHAVFPMMIRYPSWVSERSLKITVNGIPVIFSNGPSSYVEIKRSWKKGDVVTVTLPMKNHLEYLPNVSNYIAIMHGPILLAAKTGTEDMKGLQAGDGRWAHIASGSRLPVDKAPVIIEDQLETLVNRLQPVTGKPLNFTFSNVKMVNPVETVLEPFYKVHDARYMMYWMALSEKGYRHYLDSIAGVEKAKLELQQRTIDFVAPGEQQPEADHLVQTKNSGTGNIMDQFWRDARNDGYFSYLLKTNNESNLSLRVQYWGAEWGTRKFTIFIDDDPLITEDNSGKWNQSQFQYVEYKIPDVLLKGKSSVRIRFQSNAGAATSAVYYLQLIRNKQ